MLVVDASSDLISASRSSRTCCMRTGGWISRWRNEEHTVTHRVHLLLLERVVDLCLLELDLLLELRVLLLLHLCEGGM